MTQEELNKAFEGRWRLKNNRITELKTWYVGSSPIDLMEKVNELCRDFFEAGILLGEGFRTDEITFPDGSKGTVTYKYDLDVDTSDHGFTIFWDEYDKKVGKEKCVKLWSKLTLKEREMCIAYIPLYKLAQPNKQYRKNPETFLRNKCWNDELIYHDNGNKSTSEGQRSKLGDILAP